jgi:hypothetical protein
MRAVSAPVQHLRRCIQKFADCVDNKIYAYFSYYSLRSNTKDYDGKTHYTYSENSDTTAPSGRELLPFAVLAPGGQSGNFWIYLRTHTLSMRGNVFKCWPIFAIHKESPSWQGVVKVNVNGLISEC